MRDQRVVRIVAQPGIGGIRVTDSETGEPIPEVADIQISMRCDDVVRASITVLQAQVNVVTVADIEHVCQMCKRPWREEGDPKPEDYRA